jgi:oxygen-independent coproporphyrinogen-3 oxidase
MPPAGFSRPVSLYVHFPFCVHRCHYCDFSVHRTARPPVEEWIACVEREAGAWFDRAGWPRPLVLETLFLGGGTPSLIGPHTNALKDALSAYFDLGQPDLEWTTESNPASLSREVAGDWRAAGVSRISIGVQSFDDSVLSWLGRLHDAREAREAIGRALEAGIESVNIDLIFGLPAELPRDWSREVETALETGVTHVSAYGLTAEPRTPLGRRVRSGETRLAGEEGYAAEYLAAVDALEAAGFAHYEVSNFALPGHECRHNWHYWDGSSYLGLGPSAHSFIGGTRTWNVFRWEAYRRAVARGGDTLEGHETPGASESQLERLWLALRTRQGLDVREQAAAVELRSRAEDLLGAWREAGWLRRGDPHRIQLTAEGWLRMDELVAELAGRVSSGG